MRSVVTALVIALVIALGGGAAHAYPQFQISRDQTCTSCHISPAGGGTLTENGIAVAEALSQWGTKGDFMYGKISPPSWLVLGGDLRALGGYFVTPFRSPAAFPMQGELYANALVGRGLSLHVTAGIRPPQDGDELATSVWSREHYAMWQQHPDETTGWYVRVGHFMPVFGLRLAEHPDYTRRFGGTALDTEPYSAAVEWIGARAEVHATGFVRDRLIEAASVDSGGALYAEARPTPAMAFGVEGMATASRDDRKQRVGITHKILLPGDLLLESELIGTRVEIPYTRGAAHASDVVHQIADYVLVSRFLGDGLMLDVGVGYYNEDLRYRGLDREAFDVNLHWFTTSHLELILNTRLETIGFHQPVDGVTSPTGAYAALQLHYRL